MTQPDTNASGDIGTPLQAILYALSLDDPCMAMDFLREWSEGDVDEWPQYCLKLSTGQFKP